MHRSTTKPLAEREVRLAHETVAQDEPHCAPVSAPTVLGFSYSSGPNVCTIAKPR